MTNRASDLVLGTAGHIDHGKTALVRALTGVDTDRLPAEKERGITIDIGFASLELDGFHLALIDVPGHERFIRNMLAGASGLDLAMLIVAADDSVMPQTREHLEILQLLGLAGGVIVLTKCDLADSNWIDLVEDEVRSLARDTFLENSAVVRTSTATGEGIADLKKALEALCSSVTARRDQGLFRMAIDRSFTVPGHGTVVTGTVASGTVTVGDELEWQPAGRSVRVRGLHRHDRPVEQIGRGSRAAINLAGVHHSEIQRGQELAVPGYLAATRILSVEVVETRIGSPGHKAESGGAARSLRHRERYKLHLGTAEVSAVLSLLQVGDTMAGTARLGQLFVAEPVVAVFGQPFVLRAESPPATLGGGRIIQPVAPRLRRRDHAAIARLGRLRLADSLERLSAALAFLGLSPWTERRLVALTGLGLSEVEAGLASLASSGALDEVAIGPRRTVRLPAELIAELEERVLRAVDRLHAARPRHSAIPRAQLAAAFPDLPSEALVSGLIDRVTAAGKVIADSRTVALPRFQPKLSQGERKLKAELAEAIRAGGMSPPDAGELAAAAGPRAGAVPDLLQLLRDEEQLVEINGQIFLDAAIAGDIQQRVSERLADGSAITMAELRDLLGTTRKFAVPIGEYLDRIGLTKRDGDVRRLGPAWAGAIGSQNRTSSER
jgi:selenocysteine-specific elongation factor